MKIGTYIKAFLKGGKKGFVTQLGDTLKDKFATDGDRIRAIEILSFFPANLAVPQLLKRFDLVAENTLNDSRDKRFVAKILIGEGSSVLANVITYARSATNVSWVIYIIEKLSLPKEYVTILLGILSTTYPLFDDSVVKRNREIIVALQNINDERIKLNIEPHLSCRYPEIQEAARKCLENRI